MKKHFLKLITMLSLIFSLLLVSCQNSFKFSNNRKPKDFVTVYFCNDGFAGRSAGESIFMPEENILARAKKFELSGTYTGNGNFDEEYKKLTAQVFTQLSDLSSFTKDLVAGAWTFTLNAYSEYSETPFYADEVNVEISDTSYTVEFNLQPVVQDGGTGQLELKFNFPENNVTKVSYIINKVTSDQKFEPVHEDSITKNLEDSIVTKSISDLSFGNYMMTISLFSDFTNSENKENLKDTTFMGDFSVYFVIQTGLVTTVEKTFENLISYWKVTLNGNGVDLKTGVKDFFYYTAYNDIVLPTESVFDEVKYAASGMLLNGWEDESGNTLTDWKPGEVTGNLTLKASWLPYTSEYTVKNLELFENSYNAKDGTVGYDTYISSQTSEINFQNDVTEYNVDYYDTYSELNYNLRLKLPESFDSSKILITGINSDNTQTNIEGTDGVNKSDSDEAGYSYFTINHIKIMPSYEKIEIKFTGVGEKYVIIPVKSSTYYVRGGTDSILSEPPENFNLSGSKNFPFSELQTAIDILWNKTGTIVIDGVVENPQSQGGDYGYTTAQVSGDDTDITINSYSENPKNGTIKASSTPGDRVFAIWEGTVHLGENVTIKGGRCNDTCGGGIFNKGTLYLNGCIITDNEIIGGTYPLGGGIYGEKGSKIILQNGTKITSNKAYDGAGIAITGAQLIAEDCLIEGNIIKTNGHGSAIAVRSFKDSENPLEPVVGSLFELKNEAIIKDTIYLDDNQSDDDKNTLELIQLTSTISDDNEYKVQLAEYAAGILVVKSEGDEYSASYSKFKIYDALGTVSNYTVGSDGKLISENNKDTGITVEEFDRRAVPVVSGVDKLVVERSGVNKIQIPVTNEVYGYLNGSTLTCILYNSRGEIVNKDGDNDYKVASLSYIDDKYYADYYINNLNAFAIGTYTLEISANSKTDGVDLETVAINLLVVY